MQFVGSILLMALQIYSFILLARILLSYFPNLDSGNPIVQGLLRITEPVLQPVRERLPQNNYNVDFSPIIVFVGIMIVRIFVRSIFF